MRSVSLGRNVAAAVGAGAVALGLGSVGVSAASTPAARATTKPPMTVTAKRITRSRGTLAPGSHVRPADMSGTRVFTDAKHGFALAPVDGADYTVMTTDGGKSWKTDGPALHLDAAQAPLAVTFIGAASHRTLFAWGGGQVIDASSNGGKAWYSALFTAGSPVAVVPDLNGHLLAYVGSYSGSNVWQYLSKDGGRTWHYQTTVNR